MRKLTWFVTFDKPNKKDYYTPNRCTEYCAALATKDLYKRNPLFPRFTFRIVPGYNVPSTPEKIARKRKEVWA